MASSSAAGGYSYYAAGSSLHGGPPPPFAEPVWIGIFRIGIRKGWGEELVAASRNALRQFFLESPEVPVRLNVTQSMHYGQCAVLTMFDLGTHEHGLDIMGEEFIPFGYLEGGGAAKKEISSLAGGFSRPVVAFSPDWAFRIRPARHIPSMGGGVGKGIRL